MTCPHENVDHLETFRNCEPVGEYTECVDCGATFPVEERDDRELAILICSIAASNEDLDSSYTLIVDELGVRHKHDAIGLALAAWSHCLSADHVDAEAEALLRTGWSP